MLVAAYLYPWDVDDDPAAADRIAGLKRRARSVGVPVVYVNDNFGRWRSDFNAQVEHCLRDGVRGKPLVERLRPEEDDYFVLKPKHSGFFSTTLDILLDYLEVKTVILAGVAGNICVLFTANDAYMRDFHLAVPHDWTVSQIHDANDRLHEILRELLGDETELIVHFDPDRPDFDSSRPWTVENATRIPGILDDHPPPADAAPYRPAPAFD